MYETAQQETSKHCIFRKIHTVVRWDGKPLERQLVDSAQGAKTSLTSAIESASLASSLSTNSSQTIALRQLRPMERSHHYCYRNNGHLPRTGSCNIDKKCRGVQVLSGPGCSSSVLAAQVRPRSSISRFWGQTNIWTTNCNGQTNGLQ